jgi:hypothetical protein
MSVSGSGGSSRDQDAGTRDVAATTEQRSWAGRIGGAARRVVTSSALRGDVARIVLVWAAWLAVMCTFQVVAEARYQPSRPDEVLAWTQYATNKPLLDCRSRLNDPSWIEHVKYDSEYYISIAISGYDDPQVQAYYPNSISGNSGIPVCFSTNADWISLNYAFMPGYPVAIKAVSTVASVVPPFGGMTDVGRAALAGVIVSALGGLLAMLALARLMAALDRKRRPVNDSAEAAATSSWGGVGGLRAALYLLVFPTGFYLAQVYTEGLFIGLAFLCCALAVERRIFLAALAGVLAATIRPTGLCLVVPLAWAAFEIVRAGGFRPQLRYAAVVAAPLAPVVPFLAWYLSDLGKNWRMVEDGFFHRVFDPMGSLTMWGKVADSFFSGTDKTADSGGYAIFTGSNPGPLPSSSTVYIGLELLALVLALVACIWLFRRMPGVALFGLGVIVMSAGGMSAQGMDRYMLAVPAIFLMLASLGRSVVFDRAWVMGSTLVMGMLVTLYTFGFWVS